MKPYAERFPETPAPRILTRNNEVRLRIRMQCKALSKTFAPVFKAMRQDKAFAYARMNAVVAQAMTYCVTPVEDLMAKNMTAICKVMPDRPDRDAVTVDYWSNIRDLLPRMMCRALGIIHVKGTEATVSVYRTYADAKRGRRTEINFGRLLKQVQPHLTESERQRMVESYAHMHRPVTVHFVHNDSVTLSQTELADEWMRVYMNPRGFGSCMSSFSADRNHPARFYALPNNGLSLAYLTHNNKPDGDITARCIVNIQRNSLVRVYGDHRLYKALQSEPYFLTERAQHALRNVECVAREYDGRLIAPYVDGIDSLSWDGGDTCVLDDSGGYELNGTDGFASQGDDTTYCECCGDYQESWRVESIPVWTGRSVAYQDICEECRDYRFTECTVQADGTTAYVDGDTYDIAEIENDYFLYCPDLLSQLGYVFVEADDEWYPESVCMHLEYRDEWVHQSDVVALDRPHPETDETQAHRDDTRVIDLPDGTCIRVHEDWDEDEDEDDCDTVTESQTEMAFA